MPGLAELLFKMLLERFRACHIEIIKNDWIHFK